MTMAAVCGFILCLFIGLLALTILYLIWTNKINLQHLLSEADGSASMSRFQLLIFTFVIAISFFEIVESGMKLPDIPTTISSMMSRAISCRGLSEVTTAMSAKLETTSPISGRFPLSRLPPQPNTQIRRPFTCSRRLVSTLANASGVCA